MSLQDLFNKTPNSDNTPEADKEVLMVITDDQNQDYIWGVLTNKDLLRVLGKALSIGYRDFAVYLSEKDIEVMRHEKGQITVDWNIVRIVADSEWNA